MKKKRGRPKLPPQRVKMNYIEIRCEAAEKQTFQDAAQASGMALSVWMRDRLRRAGRKELEAIGKPVPLDR